MQKKMSEAGKSQTMNFLKQIADVCKKNGDNDLITLECLIEMTADVGKVAQRNEVSVLEVLSAANLKTAQRPVSKKTMSAKVKAEVSELWKSVREYLEQDSVLNQIFFNCVGEFIVNVETIAKNEDLPIDYVLDCFAVCMMDIQNGFI